jgi:hypothetical protein
METDYNKQADDFLKETGTTFEANFVGNMLYFEGDKEPRDVYQITLKRDKKTYSFRFGQSINNSGEMVKRNPYGKTIYDHELIPRRNRLGTYIGRIAPTPYDILTCVQKYDIGTFSNFCSEFGYDIDSRKASYFAVQEEYENINRLFHDVMEKLQEIN